MAARLGAEHNLTPGRLAMRKVVRRLAVVIVSALAPMGYVLFATPGVGSACDSGWWWDPVAKACREPLIS